MTHGFDDSGAKYDAVGDLRNWWTDSDKAEFEKRTSCISDEYDQFVAVDDVHLKGRLTLGENTADNGGARISLMALHNKMKEEKQAEKPIDGYTPDQRFFIAYAQVWCQNVTPPQARRRALADPHSPGRYRVNGVVSNMPEFQQTWGCKGGPNRWCARTPVGSGKDAEMTTDDVGLGVSRRGLYYFSVSPEFRATNKTN